MADDTEIRELERSVTWLRKLARRHRITLSYSVTFVMLSATFAERALHITRWLGLRLANLSPR
jgi:hypothetical protein